MIIGLVGAPNKGKSTIFSAMTQQEVPIADYAFTTINPNLGVAYVARKCVETELGVKCKPRTAMCRNGTRYMPVNVIDVAGLVPGAHLGKGMGNQFLNDLVSADALVQVVDISGTTDVNGLSAEGSDPAVDVEMVRKELAQWLAGIILRHMADLSRRQDGSAALHELLSGFKATVREIEDAGNKSYLPMSNINWTAQEAVKFSEALLRTNKPMVVAANKMDRGSAEALDALRKRLAGTEVIECSGAIELALVKAAKSGVIEYDRYSNEIKVNASASAEQAKAIAYMEGYVKRHAGTGVQRLLDTAVFGLLGNIVVYPVEDETHYTDHFGNVLPDALLMRSGSTAYDLAEKIHSELAKRMKYAVDVKRKMRVQKEYVLKDGDVIKIVSTAK